VPTWAIITTVLGGLALVISTISIWLVYKRRRRPSHTFEIDPPSPTLRNSSGPSGDNGIRETSETAEPWTLTFETPSDGGPSLGDPHFLISGSDAEPAPQMQGREMGPSKRYHPGSLPPPYS
jgi:hypothetical protein